MAITDSFKSIGDSVTKFFNDSLNWISDQTHLNPDNLSTKLLVILIFLGVIYLGTKITNKMAKWLFIIVALLLVVSVAISLG